MEDSKKLKKGFTLVELIIAIGIFSFIVVTAYSIMNSSSIFINKQINNVNKQNDIRVAIEWITKDLQSSDSLTCNETGEVLYSVKNNGKEVKYIKEYQGVIREENVYKIIREDNKDKFILIENIPVEGFLIDKLDNFFSVKICIKDKFNKDREEQFHISTKKNVFVVNKPEDGNGGDWGNCVIVSKYLDVSGGAIIEAPDSTIIVRDDKDSIMKLNGGINIFAAKIYISHSLDLDGSAKIGNADNSSSIYIDGDINLNGNAYIYKSLYYTGKLDVKHWIDVEGKKVDKINFPNVSVPSLELDKWYIERGFKYIKKGSSIHDLASDGMKILFEDSYRFPSWSTYSNVNVVSKEDITLSGNVNIDGILFAPNGRVNIAAGSSFTGIIIAKDVEISGGAQVKFQQFNIKDLPFKLKT
ncbi:prepilin-type N-terminal cleavage/methylation domain-containing protein [Clostridium sp. MSJ-11]|uniref:Prepilin-type N-terminal cleavage/methylation domain-containing protein n=1 Tax=Clostridium mobile TaxID=2841512 RepID=A0ABS6EJF7_9CLOT|nr:prepilin-type N-terminal cleavage/methylation domain-containing protein [Clostridium mobile]MBU5485342.1 prepilin-type N-terminal cleavage/methylation domain-containing protein [Clostridium mobile]